MGKRKRGFTLKLTDRKTGKEQFDDVSLNLDVSHLNLRNTPPLTKHFFPCRFVCGGLEFFPGLICDPLFCEASNIHCTLQYSETEPTIKRPKK